MSPTQLHALPTRRDFGLGYLAGVALLLASGHLVFGLRAGATEPVALLNVAIAVAVFAAMGYVALVFRGRDVSETLVWTVAQWTALGVAVGTLVTLLIGFGYGFVPTATVVPGLLVVTLGTGGLSGAVVGTATSLRNQHDQLGELTQRNAVLNRVLRHNIKNDMNVIIGHASLLGQEVDGDTERSVEAIHRAAADVTRLSEAARTIDKLGTAPESRRIDLARIVRQSVDSADSFYPGADIRADLPEEAWVEASPIVGTVVVNLLENAIEHNTGDARVDVSVSCDRTDDASVTLRVADNGPGIYEHEREVLESGEDPINHGSGMGLWLVKWFARAYGGNLWFDDNEPRGTVVHLALPPADGEPETDRDARKRRHAPAAGQPRRLG